MDALILNSGNGTRMGTLTQNQPKCLTVLQGNQTILSRQLNILQKVGVTHFIITTGKYHDAIKKYIESLKISAKFTFVQNPLADSTNYIYSMSLTSFLQGDILLLHGDLVFDEEVARKVASYKKGCMVVSTTKPLPQKDFKAILKQGYVEKVGIYFFDGAVAAQPFYHLTAELWEKWKLKIKDFCEVGKTTVYAEDALNELTLSKDLWGLDCKDLLCDEIDTPSDLIKVRERLQ